MILRLVTLCCLAVAAFLAGCASTPQPPAVKIEPATTEPVGTKPADNRAAPEAPRVIQPAPTPPVSSHKKNAAKQLNDTADTGSTVLQPGEYKLTVESEPPGATVVMNGKPCGKTPCVVIVQANARGFLREQISIKVRFIAANEAEESQTVEEVLTTLDKVPAEIRFTSAGATRVVR
jgi:hypothetical protein